MFERVSYLAILISERRKKNAKYFEVANINDPNISARFEVNELSLRRIVKEGIWILL